MKRTGFHRLPAFLVLSVLLTGCSTTVLRDPVPENLVDTAEVSGIPNARFWGDDVPPRFEQNVLNMTAEEARKAYPAMFGRQHNYLAISGGGAEGAFGAGLLVGWSEAGDRPKFQVVTGVSTGALISIWAFLGPEYDNVLREVYTTISGDDIYRRRFWLAIPFSDAAADSTPLLELIGRYVTDDVVRKIAEEHKAGRKLFIGTTDLDSMRPRIWNIGEIAASGEPGAKTLIHSITLASASIPGAFPPVRIEVKADGETYDELHVDGGTAAQVFVYPAATNWRKALKVLDVPGRPNIYVIRNAALIPDREEVKPRLIPIAGKSVSSLIRTQGLGDLYQIYMLSRRDGANYFLAFVREFEEKSKTSAPFDREYMNRLFDQGYDLGKNGYPWLRTPPGWVRPIDEEG